MNTDMNGSMYRRLSRLTLALVIAAVSLVACDNVAVEPTDQVTADVIFQQEGAYESYLAKLYGGLSLSGLDGPTGNGDIGGIDEGFSQYIRLWWQMQELPTDGAVIAFNDGAVQELNTNSWSPANGFSSAMYSRVFFQVAQANEFLRQSTPELLDQRTVPDDVQQAMPQWRAEARFLRALSYWHGLDLFRNIPVVEEDFPIGGGAPDQNSAQEVFDFIEAELLAITGDGAETLPDPGQNEYGRADKAAAWMLLAKLYQNAEVYVGEDRQADVITYTQRIIDSGEYQLAEDYQYNYLADNNRSPELIFSVPQDGERMQNFGGTNFLTCAAYGGNINPADFGMTCAFGGLRTTPETVDLFPAGDARAIFFTDGQSKQIDDLLDYQDGFAVTKYRNVTRDGESGPNGLFPDTDYPMFRLGDVYLMYAEAVVRGGGGSRSTALGYVNDLRERAGLGRDITDGDLTLDFILDERGRELMWEATRRIDLVRFGQYTNGGPVDGQEAFWSWKGDIQEGGSIPGYLSVYPLPESELAANPNLTQNPEY